MTHFIGLLRSFLGGRRGNVAVTFVIASIPIMAAVGSAVDLSRAVRVRSKLQAAADSASVAAVALKSPGAVAAGTMSGNGNVSAGSTDALNVFNANLTGGTDYTNLSVTASVTKTGVKLASVVQFSADVTMDFMPLVGFKKITVTGTSNSTSSIPSYLDFYLMLDVSGSMGLPSTNNEQTRLAAINPDNYSQYPNGCTFACHFSSSTACSSGQKYNTNGYCMGYALSRTAGNSSNTPVSACTTDGTSACIQLRADAVGYAVQQLLLTANSTQKVTNQFRIGLYPFIQYLYSYFPLTNNISGTSSGTIGYAATNLATQLDTGNNSNLGSGGTHFENALPSMNSLITSVGDGTSQSSTQPFVFLVTDGAQNNQTQWGGGWAGNNNATIMDNTLCTPLKQRGITISILYIPYQPIQNPTSFANNEDFAVNAIIPDIPNDLLNCASNGFFFTANTPADITTALNAMFNKALVTAHITN